EQARFVVRREAVREPREHVVTLVRNEPPPEPDDPFSLDTLPGVAGGAVAPPVRQPRPRLQLPDVPRECPLTRGVRAGLVLDREAAEARCFHDLRKKWCRRLAVLRRV